MIPITVSVYLKKNGENKIMKILVTGFDPFGGEKVNPAYEAVKLLPDTIHGAEIVKLEIPTVFSKCGPSVEEDNQGEQPVDELLQSDGENAYFASLPVKAMMQNVREHGLPCSISYTAGTYVCNAVMYNVLYMCAKRYPNIRAGFIHVPYASGQVIDKAAGTPSMTLEAIEKSIEYAIEAIVDEKVADRVSAGETH